MHLGLSIKLVWDGGFHVGARKSLKSSIWENTPSAWPSSAWLGSVWPELGPTWLGPARLGSARLGSVWLGLGPARLGSARPGPARPKEGKVPESSPSHVVLQFAPNRSSLQNSLPIFDKF